MKKILVSPNFGAGWSSWNDDKIGKYMAEYEPIIEVIERGEQVSQELLEQLKADIKEKFGDDIHICVLGAKKLEVRMVDSKYRILEYDGSERVEVEESIDWW